jgi:Lon protease-like protein
MNNQNSRKNKNQIDETGRAAQTPSESETNGNTQVPGANSAPAESSHQKGKASRLGNAKANRTGHSPRGQGRTANAPAQDDGEQPERATSTSEKSMRSGRIRAARDAERLALVMQGGARTNVRKHRWTEAMQNQQEDDKRNPLSPRMKFETPEPTSGNGVNAQADGQNPADAGEAAGAMVMPLFPLKNVVLFPGMVLPLHIFEQRYREMINTCIEEESQFGVVLIDDGDEVGGGATPCAVGTAARITKVTRQDDGRLNIVAVGTQRFEVLSLDHSKSYLQATVKPLPVVNGSTRLANDLVHKLMPRIFEYVDLLEQATKQKLPINRLPEDPSTLAILVAIGMQAPAKDKQTLLEKAGIPEMLAYEAHLLSREALFLRHMVETQHDVMQMNMGPTGYIFPN